MCRRKAGHITMGVLFLLLGLACGLPHPSEATLSPTPSQTPTATAVSPSPVPSTATPTATAVAQPPAATATTEPTTAAVCPQIVLAITFQQTQSLTQPPIANNIEATGEISLTVDTSTTSPRVHGEGSLPISGSGHAGECAWTNTGTLDYRLEGEIVPDAAGKLELHLRGERAMDIQSTGECGGGGSTPYEPMEETVLPYQDGYTLEWSWSVAIGGVKGHTSWQVIIPCHQP